MSDGIFQPPSTSGLFRERETTEPYPQEDEIDLDECLDPCCAKDKRELEFFNKTMEVLRKNDVTNRATPDFFDPRMQCQPVEDESDLDSLDDDTDEDLNYLRQQRLEQMKQAVSRTSELQRQGHGTCGELKENQLQEELDHGADMLVCHFYIQGAEVCDRVDELLDMLAPRYVKIKFARLSLHKKSEWLKTLDVALPALVCFRGGVVVAKAPGLMPCGGTEDFDETLAQKWLAQAGMLPGYTAGVIDSDDDQEEEECWACEDCGRTYRHEHVRAIDLYYGVTPSSVSDNFLFSGSTICQHAAHAFGALTGCQLAGAKFIAAVRTLQREHFDGKVYKAVQRKLFESKEERFSGNESHASAIFARLVSALRTSIVTEDTGFAVLFTLEDAILPLRVEANDILFSTLELLVHPTSPAADWIDSSNSAFPSDGKRVLLEFARRMLPSDAPFQGQSDMLGVRVLAKVDPHDAISDFNAALKATRTRATLDDEDVRQSLFIRPLDKKFYQPAVSRRLLHDQRAAHDLLTIQQWVRECFTTHVKAGTDAASAHRYSRGRQFMERDEHAADEPDSALLADLRTMVLDLKRQLVAFTASDESTPSPRGYTPREPGGKKSFWGRILEPFGKNCDMGHFWEDF
ncbi:hypothetical protein CYMTET_43803 [Cymbomonas tetramitiformis]|uniref:Phosducin domain-containing protein n=1 Tax=Cymbomonas tetramitiformis TaxID=36881 RepID=A0AAE0C354_9CHLO|nr:hypothetical protein CYMTET_43803 [Cymbomonas tetramitiformis]